MGNKLYVGNLAYSVRDEDLNDAFSQFGAVQSAKVMMDRETGRSKGFGFVEMGSDQAANAAMCAAEQDKFWEMHDLLFAKQNDLTHNKLIQYGSELGLNVEQYKSCVDAKKYESDIQRDVIEGDSYKIRGTPILYINGERIDDASIDGLRYHIDNLLK